MKIATVDTHGQRARLVSVMENRTPQEHKRGNEKVENGLKGMEVRAEVLLRTIRDGLLRLNEAMAKWTMELDELNKEIERERTRTTDQLVSEEKGCGDVAQGILSEVAKDCLPEASCSERSRGEPEVGKNMNGESQRMERQVDEREVIGWQAEKGAGGGSPDAPLECSQHNQWKDDEEEESEQGVPGDGRGTLRILGETGDIGKSEPRKEELPPDREESKNRGNKQAMDSFKPNEQHQDYAYAMLSILKAFELPWEKGKDINRASLCGLLAGHADWKPSFVLPSSTLLVLPSANR